MGRLICVMRNKYVDIERLNDKYISLDWSVNKWVNDVDISLALSHEDLEPVKHGQWIKNGDRYCECSVCHHEGNISGQDNYCWFCGAKMDEVIE